MLSFMALLGTGANMQCNGHFPGYYSPRDLIFGAEGTSSNGNSEIKNDCYQIGSLPFSSSCHLLAYNKELLKQTILNHEAIFRDQIHELHRIYQKQRELMDEIKRNEFYKHNLRLETSWSSSSLCHSSNLPQLTGQPSVLIAESIQLPLASAQEKSRQTCPAIIPAPTAIKDFLKDCKPSESTYRKVGNKILDLQLPAEEYIDSEGDSLEIEGVTEMPHLSAFTLNGTSHVMCNSDEKPYGANYNGFADLNVPFKPEEGTGLNSDDLEAPIHHRNSHFPELSRRTQLRPHNFPNDVIQNLSKREDLEDFSDDPMPKQGNKLEQQPLSNNAGQSGGVLNSLAKFNDTERQSVSVESLSKKLEQINSFPCFQSLHQITPRPWTEGSAGTQGCTGSGWLGPSSASWTGAPYKLVSETGTKSSGVSSPVLFKSIKSGPNLDSQNYLPSSSFCSRSKLLHLPSISTDDLNSCDNHGSSSASHELRKYVQGSEDVGNPNNINLNIMPAGYSEDKYEDSRLPSLKEKPVPQGKPNEESKTSTQIESVLLNPYKSVDIHCGLKLNKIEGIDLSNTLAFDNNGKIENSKVCQKLSKNQCIEEIVKIPDVNSPVNHIPEKGEQIPADEQFLENEKTKHEHLAGIIDLNSCMNEDENMPMDIDFQAPSSPENKECSPPRGESDENQVEMLFQLAGQEDPEAQEDQAKMAAEALVSISGVAAHNELQMTTCPPSESFVSSPLNWFAGIVSTIVDHSVSEVKLDGTSSNLEQYLPADFDYFEFMTLNLTETKVLDCCYKSSGQTEQEAGSTSPTQPRKCRTNRGRRGKDFQSEILPSLASLSRYEVTEDLQTIGGLVEAAGTCLATGYARSAGRNVLAKGRRRSCTSGSNITELLLLNSNTELSIEKRGLISWGKICRKRRGQRFPISNPQLILSQVHN